MQTVDLKFGDEHPYAEEEHNSLIDLTPFIVIKLNNIYTANIASLCFSNFYTPF